MPTPAALIRAAERTIPVADAEFLLGHLIDRSRHRLYLETAPIDTKTIRRFLQLVDRAKTGTPVQYLVRSAPFLDFSVCVDRRVLIPRPETEELVTRALARMPAPASVVDYGTGSGCIAIAVARHHPGARVVAVDVSPAAIEVARLNTHQFGLTDRVRFVIAGSAAGLGDAVPLGSVDLLISNPPYIPSARLPSLDPNVRDHEPHLSLDGGADGTKILAMLIEEGPPLLAPGGLMALEIDAGHADRLKTLLPDAVIEPDLAGRPRYLFHTPGRKP